MLSNAGGKAFIKYQLGKICKGRRIYIFLHAPRFSRRRGTEKISKYLRFHDIFSIFQFRQLSGLKGQSNEIFDLQFFSTFEPVWVTDQWVKIFLVEISLRYSNFSVEKSDSPGYHTPERLTCRTLLG